MKLDDLKRFLNSLNLELNEQQKNAIMKYKPKKDSLEELGSFKNKSKDKDSNTALTNDGIIKIQNHRFNPNTKILGCGGSGKVRRYVIPNTPKNIEDKE